MTNLEYHEYANIFPMITGNEFEEFKKDISKNGLRDPIWIYDDKILDGRNRYKACKETGVEPRFSEYEGNNPLSFVVSLNLQRRHLDTSQRSMVAGKLASMRQGTRTDIVEISTMSQTEAANQLNVSRESVISAKKVIKNGSDELNKSVESGQVAVSTAAIISKLPKENQDEIVARGKEEIKRAAKEINREEKKEKAIILSAKKDEALSKYTKEITDNKPSIYLQECCDFLHNVDDSSVDILITDPPYSTDVENINDFVIDWLPVALRKVKDNGRAYVCIGAYPNEISAYLSVLSMQDRFTVDNPLVWTYRNTLGVTPKYKYNLNYQLILHLYSEQSRPLDTSITNEMFSVHDINAPDGRLGDRFHAWQKPDELSNRLLRHSSQPGDIVIDPFACTGTFLISASRFDCKATGCDISQDNLGIAESRGCNVIY